jgi:hypothetical protein
LGVKLPFSSGIDPLGICPVAVMSGVNSYKPAMQNRVRLAKAFDFTPCPGVVTQSAATFLALPRRWRSRSAASTTKYER